MAGSDAVERARALLEERRAELREELEQVEQALAGLAPRKRGPGRPRGSGSSAPAAAPEGERTGAAAGGKRRRRRQGGTRAEHALSHITANPGANASEIASAMGIKPNYVYRVMAELEKEGRVRKEGKGYFPATADAGDGEPDATPDTPDVAPATTGTDEDAAEQAPVAEQTPVEEPDPADGGAGSPAFSNGDSGDEPPPAGPTEPEGWIRTS